jgi:hypothetical protein
LAVYAKRTKRICICSYAAEMEESTTVEFWRKAIDQVQQSQAFSSVCIEPNPGGKPYFRREEGASIPMRILKGISERRWETEIAKEVFEPFSGDVAPLTQGNSIYMEVTLSAPRRRIFPRWSGNDDYASAIQNALSFGAASVR